MSIIPVSPEEVGENCGIAAVVINSPGNKNLNAPYYLYKLLLSLQGRGQLSAGITTYNPLRKKMLATYKNLGTVNEAFKTSVPERSKKIFEKYSGMKGIAHNRYATSGADDKEYAQPFERVHGRKWKWFSFAFNGNLANYAKLKKKLQEEYEYTIVYDTDTEVIMHYISRELAKWEDSPDLVKVFANLSKIFDGAYNIVFLDASGRLVAFRDPTGFRPLVYGTIKDRGAEITLVASETNALANLGVKDYHFVQPGEMLLSENGKVSVKRVVKSKRVARCMFEWVYFSNVASEFDGRSVYLARTALGRELAKLEKNPIKDAIVVAVPDSSKAAGDGFAYQLGLPIVEGLVRNRFVGRTFIESRDRAEKVREKFTVLRSVLEGKKVYLVDDSIVRGTTTKSIVGYIKEVGKAKEVHVRISCPPIMGPCFYGIDMSTVEELFAPKFLDKPYPVVPDEKLREMADELGADSLIYQSFRGLVKALEIPEDELCLACVTREYPTKNGEELLKVALKEKNTGGRTYEREL